MTQQLLVAERARGGDRTECELRAGGVGHLANDQDIQFRRQPGGQLVGDHDSPARQPEDEQAGRFSRRQDSAQHVHQLPPGIAPVEETLGGAALEHRASPQHRRRHTPYECATEAPARTPREERRNVSEFGMPGRAEGARCRS